MPIGIVIGGQYGSEGKGKVALWLSTMEDARVAVRVGGPNSEHTVYYKGDKRVFRQLPVGVINNAVAVFPSGSYIDLDVLNKELSDNKDIIKKDSVFIDPNACVITKEDKDDEEGLVNRIASTGCGIGSSLIGRIKRDLNGRFRLAKHVPELQGMLTDTKKLLRSVLDINQYIVVEGTQGYGLSLLHAEDYPYVTARDTTAAGFLSEVGLSPFDVSDICMAIRTFPIRVGGNSGSLKNETSWDDISRRTGKDIQEFTTVTNRTRRVAEFDIELVNKAIIANNPNMIFLNHCDYLFSANKSEKDNLNYVSGVVDTLNTKLRSKITHFSSNPYSVFTSKRDGDVPVYRVSSNQEDEEYT